MSYSEIVETRGDYRAKIVADDSPVEPDYDGQGAVIHVYRDGYGSLSSELRACDGGPREHKFDPEKIVPERRPATEEGWDEIRANYRTLESWRKEALAVEDALTSAANRALERGIDDQWAFVERYLRTFHAVVSFDRISWDRDDLICVITRTMQERWGVDDENIGDQAEAALRIWKMYGDGDCYYVQIEKRETWRKDGTEETRDEWEAVETLGGYYGDEDATEAAKELLAEAIPNDHD